MYVDCVHIHYICKICALPALMCTKTFIITLLSHCVLFLVLPLCYVCIIAIICHIYMLFTSMVLINILKYAISCAADERVLR